MNLLKKNYMRIFWTRFLRINIIEESKSFPPKNNSFISRSNNENINSSNTEYKFADLHCHPHMRSFNWFRDSKIEKTVDKYHPWHIISSNPHKMLKSKRAAAYSQSDLIKLQNGNMRLLFVALYPLEKGWVTGRSDLPRGDIIKLYKLLGKSLINRAISESLSLVIKFLAALISKDNRGKLAARDFLQSLFMKIPLKRINFIQSDKFNYFEELNKEKAFILSKNNQTMQSSLFIPPFRFRTEKGLKKKYPAYFDASGRYIIAKNGDDVAKIIQDRHIAFVLTIEGTNVFNSTDNFSGISKKILEVKSWSHPVFFITFAHHFYNDLCGHAHSVPDIGTLVIDQTKGITNGFTEKGWKVIRLLLSLDENKNYQPGELGRRILIDVKHINAKARKEYYDQIVIPCMEQKNDIIPIIASHCAYSGVETLVDLISNWSKEDDDWRYERKGVEFNAWNINLCDEEIILIHKTGGIIGINFDQRILGVASKKDKLKKSHFDFIWNNIIAIVEVILNSDELSRDAKDKVWDLMALGTDFDGYIDPANDFPTAIEFSKFRDELTKRLSKPENKKYLLNNLSAEDIAEKICFENAYQFVLMHFK